MGEKMMVTLELTLLQVQNVKLQQHVNRKNLWETRYISSMATSEIQPYMLEPESDPKVSSMTNGHNETALRLC